MVFTLTDDDIKKSNSCSNLETAIKAERLKKSLLEKGMEFTFETVVSTDRNLKLLKKAKEKGYYIRCIFVLTSYYNIHITRISLREKMGGHIVPEEKKIISRYKKDLNLIPELLEICDIAHIYDNTYIPFRILKKEKQNIIIGKMSSGTIQILKELLEFLSMKINNHFYHINNY